MTEPDDSSSLQMNGFTIATQEDGSIVVYSDNAALAIKPRGGNSVAIYHASIGQNPQIIAPKHHPSQSGKPT